MAVQLLQLEDSVIRSMMQDVRYLSTIPCLAEGKRQLDAAMQKADCGSCRKTRTDARADIMTQIRNCLAGMNAQSRQQLKQLSGAKSVRIIKRVPRGTVKITF